MMLSSAFAQYTIPAFATGGRSIPPQEDEVIAASPGAGALKEIPSFPSLAPGEVVMRRRFGGEEYRLYKGVFAQNAFGKDETVFRFDLRAGMTIAQLAMLKVYADRSTNPNNDLQTVYFDNTYAYIRIVPKLFFYTDTWKTLDAANLNMKLKTGDLNITSSPPGAAIAIDGKQTKYTTPFIMTNLTEGKHQVAVALETYQDGVRDVSVVADETKTADFTFVTALGTLSITSEPSGADVWIDGEKSGVTPVALERMKSRKYAVKCAMQDYKPGIDTVFIPMNGVGEKNVILQPTFGTLVLPELPDSGNYLIDGAKNKILRMRLAPGNHRVVYNGGTKWSGVDTTVQITLGNETSIHFKAVRLTGFLSISVEPGDAEISVDGKVLNPGAIVLRYETGDYVVAGKKTGYTRVSENARIVPGETCSVKLVLPQIPDRDGDGVLDDVDKCPDEVGKVEFDGCKEQPPKGMALIPGGTFMMGSNDGESDEKPVHQVTVNGFYMDKTEVTQAEYERVMGTNPSYFKGCPDCPVEKVIWYDAKEYCDKVGKRLPTEAEWEYAARAGSTTKYYWGNGAPDAYAWYNGNSESKTHPVGQKQPNAWGLYDMSGNVWEWCSDWYDLDYSKSSSQNPQGPSSGEYRVLRGGLWGNLPVILRSAVRYRFAPDSRLIVSGFRCVRSRQ